MTREIPADRWMVTVSGDGRSIQTGLHLTRTEARQIAGTFWLSGHAPTVWKIVAPGVALPDNFRDDDPPSGNASD